MADQKADTKTNGTATAATPAKERAEPGTSREARAKRAILMVRNEVKALCEQAKSKPTDYFDAEVWKEVNELANEIAENQNRNLPLADKLTNVRKEIEALYSKASKDLKFFNSEDFQTESTRLINQRTRIENAIAKEKEEKKEEENPTPTPTAA